MARDRLSAVRNRLDRDEWSRYWERGTVTTFEGHFGDNYDAEIRDFWWRQFAALDDHAVIVDLATGNGALALLAARFAREHGRSFSITGLDSASVDAARLRAQLPELAPDLDAIELRGDTPLEETGMPAGTVDLVTSQFGFEYGDISAGAREACRVLRSGGRLALILHHEGSAILAQAREGLRQVELCVEDEQLLARARLLIKLLASVKPAKDARGPKLSPGAEKVRDEMLASIERIRAHAGRPEVLERDAGFIAFLVPAVMRLVDQSRRAHPRHVEQAWAAIHAEIESYRMRMVDLVSAAQDEAGIGAIRETLAAAGFTSIRHEPLYYGPETLLGWCLTARRE
jgi:SAM-dependent methyltransferase